MLAHSSAQAYLVIICGLPPGGLGKSGEGGAKEQRREPVSKNLTSEEARPQLQPAQPPGTQAKQEWEHQR